MTSKFDTLEGVLERGSFSSMLRLTPYNNRVVIPDAPKLEAYVTHAGFNVSDGRASFVCTNATAVKPVEDFLSYVSKELSPTEHANSRLTIFGEFGGSTVNLRTSYASPSSARPGSLAVVRPMSEGEALFETLRMTAIYASTARAPRVDMRLAQEAADKAHRVLHIDYVYERFAEEFAEERAAAIRRSRQAFAETVTTPQDRTLLNYLRS